MKRFKKVLAALLVAIMLVSVAPVTASATQSRTDYFNKSYSYSSNPADYIMNIAQAQIGRTTSQMGYTEAWCADFVGDCAKLAGQEAAIPLYGGCGGLLTKVLNAGGQKVSNRQKGDLVFYYCTVCGCYVHVGLVLDNTYSVEGNFGGKVTKVKGIYWDTEGHSTTSGTVVKVYVRPNYSNTVVDTSASYANLGDDFYAYIIKYNSWKHLEGSESLNVQIAENGNDSCDPKQIWHFVRQNDNSYKIINEYNGKCMDACNWGTENGTNVGTWTDSGNSAQRWYLVQSGGGYKIKASYTDLYLDCCGDSSEAGTNIQLYKNNDTPAQIFNIYYLTNDGTNYAKIWPSPVTVNVTIYSDEITVSWSDSKLNNEFDKREYDLRVYDSNDNVVYSKLKLTENSHTFNLTQSGTYTVSVASVNSKYWECFNFSEKKSFTINKLTICYDCYNGYETQIDTSKGFYFGDYNRLCTTSNSNQEMDGTANVYFQTLTEGNTIGKYGLHDFSTFGLIAPSGYRFAGWKSGDNGKIFDETTTTYTATDFVDGIQNNDMHVWLTAQFEPDSYLVKFDANGGSCSTVSKTVTYKSSYGTLPVPIKENYSFDGWYTEPDGGQKVTAESKVDITSDTTLYAHWKIKTYTITYYLNGGSGLNIFQRSQSKKHDVDLTLLTKKPTGKKYTIYYNANGGEVSPSSSSIAQQFKNWNTKSDGTGVTYESGDIYQKNETLSLYAQYSYPQIGSLPTPTRSGYSFEGWYTAANGGTKITDSTKITANTTIYAHWIPNTYTITYNTNGGSGTISTQTFLRGSTTNISTEEPIGKSFIINYDANGGNVSKLTESVSQSFLNWNTKPDGSGSSYEAGGAFKADQNTILYAQYTNPILGLIPTPTRIGYVFDGWYTEPDGGKKISGYTEISDNLILFAHWTKKSTDRLTVNNVKIEDNILIDYKSDYNIIPKIDADPGSEYTISYESYDESIAKVDSAGKVHGIKKGNTVVVCTVTDSYGNVVKDSCNVNVDYSGAQWFIIIVLFGWIWYI